MSIQRADVPYFSQWETPETSVSSGIRWSTGASTETIRFPNPSGHDRQSQADVTLPLAVFDQFFANRGIAVGF